MAFNIGQYVLSVAAGAAVLSALSGTSFWAPHELVPSLLPALAAAAVVFFLVNSMLVARAVTLAEGAAFWGYLRRDIALQTSTVGILLGLAPIVVITADFSLAALPLLGLPLFAVYGAGRQAITNQRQALHDALTKLPNRTLFEERLDQALRLARRDERGPHGDADRPRPLQGDQRHARPSRGRRACCRRSPARLVRALRDERHRRALRRRRVRDPAAGARGRGGGRRARAEARGARSSSRSAAAARLLQVGASIGVARFPTDGDDARTLLRRADVAMYRAKHARSGYRALRPAEDPHSPERLQLASDLHHAVECGELVAHFQPKVRLERRPVEGMEVLMRWPHPERGMISPDEFIPLAEDCGLIVPVTTIALDAAMRECRAWRDAGIDIRFAVNVSGAIARRRPDRRRDRAACSRALAARRGRCSSSS